MKKLNPKPIGRKSNTPQPLIGANPAALGERTHIIRGYRPDVLRLPKRPEQPGNGDRFMGGANNWSAHE